MNTLPPFQRGSETSREASIAMHKKAPTLRDKVHTFLASKGERGATDQEAQEALGLTSDTQVPRRYELVRAGLVRAKGETRKNRSGVSATVWITTAAYNRMKQGGRGD